MRGIVSAGGYVPHWRLQRAAIAALFGSGGGKGTRAVAGYDEDTTTMGVAAARIALSATERPEPAALWFATADPAYLDKTNACAIHAALRLPETVPALDFGGAVRSGIGALLAALRSSEPVLVVTSDRRGGLPTSADEAQGGDAAAAVLVGSATDGALVAELAGTASTTREFLDRWRTPGDRRSKQWEERFGEATYVPLGEQAWDAALKDAGIAADEVDRVVVTGVHTRARSSLLKKLRLRPEVVADDLAASVGNTGTAHALLLLAAELESAPIGSTIALLSLADGADVAVFRRTEHLPSPTRTVTAQTMAGADVAYGRFLAWRGMVTPEPPRRPEPDRVSAPAASRAGDWKLGFVGTRSADTGEVRLPPRRSGPGAVAGDLEPAAMADALGTVVTFTVDRLAYSPSPPVVFAVADFDGGGRFPVELTDVDPEALAIGDRVEMTFRRISTADGIHNYFWKARPVREG